MTRGYFITGTDTGVGKTFVTTHLARRARHHGHRVFAFKPIETGCQPPAGEDQRLLVTAAGDWQTNELGGVYQLSLPAAPLVAAEAEGLEIDIDRIDRAIAAGQAASSFTLVEGAGGWRVPITSSMDMGGFARRIGLPVLLVARATLGTINHTRLSAEAIQRDGCVLAGVVLSRKPSDAPELISSNIAQISRRAERVVVLEQDGGVLDSFIPM